MARPASCSYSMRTMPRPRTSSRPHRLAGARPTSMLPRRSTVTWSSATSRASRVVIRRRARSDLPHPEGPHSRIPRPCTERQVACRVSLAVAKRSSLGGAIAFDGGEPHGEPGAEHRRRVGAGGGGMPVGRGDLAAMRLDDLPRYRQAETGILAEIARRAIGVEAIEDAGHLVGIDAGALVVDAKLHLPCQPPQAHRDGRARRREGRGIVDQIAHHLTKPVVMTENGEGLVETIGRPYHLEADMGST